MNRGFYGFLLVLGLIMCSCSQSRKGNTFIGGRISEANTQQLRLEELGMQNSVLVDSLILDAKGDFSFDLLLKEPGLYLLVLPKLPPLVMELKPGDSIKVTADSKSFPFGVMLKGSGNSSDLLGFFNATMANRKIYDSLENVLLAKQEEPDFARITAELDELLKPLWENQRELEINYIGRHLNSLTSLLVLNQGLGVNPILAFKTDSVYFLRLDSSLNIAFRGNRHADFHHKRILQERELATMKKHSK